MPLDYLGVECAAPENQYGLDNMLSNTMLANYLFILRRKDLQKFRGTEDIKLWI
jgi:hypothetical protein